ncbi:hypothetical protein BC938DRAFT_472330, partial [Jimgerdemannia flammicorona]
MPTETVQQTHRNAATARAANCWDNLHDPETAHKVAGAFDDAHFVPERMFGGEEYENGLHVYGQIPAFPMTIIADDGISTWGYFSCWDYLVQMVMGGLEFETDRNEDDMQSITDCEEVLMEGTVLVENVERMHPFTLPPLDPKPLPPIPPPPPWLSKPLATVRQRGESTITSLANSPRVVTVLLTKKKSILRAANFRNSQVFKQPTTESNELRRKRSGKTAKTDVLQAQSQLMSSHIVHGWLNSQVPYFNQAMAGGLGPLCPFWGRNDLYPTGQERLRAGV